VRDVAGDAHSVAEQLAPAIAQAILRASRWRWSILLVVFTTTEKLEYLLNHSCVDEMLLYLNGDTYAIRLLRPFHDGAHLG
jgi:hypothetical protein